MIPADLSALASPRGGKVSSDGKSMADGTGASRLGAHFGEALDGLAGRRKGPEGRGAEALEGEPREGGAARRGGDAPAGGEDEGEPTRRVRGEPAFRSLAAALERALPIRAGALALQGRVGPQAEAEPEPPVENGAPSPALGTDADVAERLLAALAGASATTISAKVSVEAAGAKAAARAAPVLPASLAGDGDAPLDGLDLPSPTARGAAFLAAGADLSLATRPEPSIGMALKATVVSQATHLPPALGAANLAVLVDAAAALLAEGELKGRASLAFSPDLAASGATGKAQPVKVLTVQLQPVSLGTVTIALRMTADGVAMEITAADAKAAALLRRDEKLIVDAVRRSGLAGEVVAIHTAEGARAANASQNAGSDAAGNGQAQAGDGQTKHGEQSERGTERGRPEEFSLERRSDDDQPNPESAARGGSGGGSRGDGVYL